MPYVPSKKTDGESTDREVLDSAVEAAAEEAAEKITGSSSLVNVYKELFLRVAEELNFLLNAERGGERGSEAAAALAKAIYEVGEKYGYEGAFLGELNYAMTRFIQRVPRVKAERGEWEKEFRYWVYAGTAAALVSAARETAEIGGKASGINGVFEDIKDEYKRRMNTAYEAEQIVKSGDCYDGPYYTRLVEVVDEGGNHVGYQEIMLKRSDETLERDVLDLKMALRRKKQ